MNGIKKMDAVMSSQVSLSWSQSSLKIDLSSIQPEAANALDDRIQLVTQNSIEHQKTQPTGFEIPIRRREQIDLISEVLSQSQTEIQNRISTIHQHCKGSLEDIAFFSSAEIPTFHEDEQIHEIYTLVSKIRKEGLETELLSKLKTLCEKVSHEKGFSIQRHSPCPFHAASTTCNTPPIVMQTKLLDQKDDPNELDG
jgi:hypothetical protein